MTKRVLIVGAAPARDGERFYRALLEEYGLVVAADAAGEWCVRLGRVPDITVGDFDSAALGASERLAAAGCHVVGVPADKDFSDLDLCARQARALGADEVVFAAAFTERPDHTLAAFGSVVAASDLLAIVREPDWTAWAVGGAGPRVRRIPVSPGQTFSVMSPAGASGVCIEGARYPLVDGELSPLSSLGLSNLATGNEVVVSVKAGCAIVLAMTV